MEQGAPPASPDAIVLDTARDSLRRAAQACRLLLLIAPPAAIALAFMVALPASVGRRVAFVAYAVAAAVAGIAALTRLLSRIIDPSADIRGATRLAIAALAVSALTWPLAVVVLPPRTDAGDYLVLFFCVAASASSLTASPVDICFRETGAVDTGGVPKKTWSPAACTAIDGRPT